MFLGTGPQSYMDVEALRAAGVTVHAIKGYGDTAVAEHAIALMFACARDLARMDREIRAGIWRPREGVQLTGKRLGIIGLGGIGAEVARIARGIGMEVLGLEPDAAAGSRAPSIEAGAAGSRRGVAASGFERRDAGVFSTPAGWRC